MPSVVLWGSSNPKRELLHVDDLADACIFLSKMNEKAFDRFFDDNHAPLINIGGGKDSSIKEMRPLKNVHFCSSSRKGKILTTPVRSARPTGQAGIH